MQISYGTNPEITFFPLEGKECKVMEAWPADNTVTGIKKQLLSIYLYY